MDIANFCFQLMLAYPGILVLAPMSSSPVEVMRKAVGQIMASILVANCKNKMRLVLGKFGIGLGWEPLPYPWVWEI